MFIFSIHVVVQAEYEYSIVSTDPNNLEVIFPKNRLINSPFQYFLDNHPHMFPLLRQVMGLQ